MNLWLFLRPHKRTSPGRAVRQLSFDLVQISTLMALTGGMANPFALLVLAPGPGGVGSDGFEAVH